MKYVTTPPEELLSMGTSFLDRSTLVQGMRRKKAEVHLLHSSYHSPFLRCLGLGKIWISSWEALVKYVATSIEAFSL